MKIFVCLKQVPSTNKVEVDEETGVLKRDGVESKMNPYDLYALEMALQLKEKKGATVCVGSMGPMQAMSVLREAFMMGADDAYLFSDRAFAGADVLATSFTLSQAIMSIDSFDLILCGKQTIDGDTAQVGPAIAEFMHIPHVAWVTDYFDVSDTHMSVRTLLSEHVQTVEVSYPCLLTIEKDANTPRLPSYRKKIETLDKTITVKSLQDFDCIDPSRYGLNGSPTQVEKIFPPAAAGEQRMFEGNAKECANALYTCLKAQKIV